MSETNLIGEWTKSWAEKNNLHCEYQFETPSTNDFAKEYPYVDDTSVLFVTESQTKGRGRGSNLWLNSKPGSSLLSTWSFQLTQPPQPITTPLLGLAVYRSLRSAFGIQKLSLKAPNDIYIDGKKAGGLLVEVISQNSSHRVLVGFGLNIFSKPEIANTSEVNSYSSEPINSSSWNLFLSMLFDEFQRAVHQATEPYLPQLAREELLVALNQNPNISEKFVAIELNGSLRTKNTTISWDTL